MNPSNSKIAAVSRRLTAFIAALVLLAALALPAYAEASSEQTTAALPLLTETTEDANAPDALDAADVRVELDDRAEKLGYRMREAQVQKVPYLLVIGFNEMEEKTVSYKLHGEKDATVMPLDEFVKKIDEEIKNKLRNK